MGLEEKNEIKNNQEIERAQRLDDLFDYFYNFADQNYIDDLKHQQITVPWKVIYDTEINQMRVMYSHEFLHANNLNPKIANLPLFTFHLNSPYTNSYERIRNPFTYVEINTVTNGGERYFDVRENNWEIEIDDKKALIVKSPKDMFVSENDIDTTLQTLTKPNNTDTWKSIHEVIKSKLKSVKEEDKEKVIEILRFGSNGQINLQECMDSLNGLELTGKCEVNELRLIKVLLEYVVNIDNVIALSYLKSTDRTRMLKTSVKIGLLVGGVTISLLSINELLDALEDIEDGSFETSYSSHVTQRNIEFENINALREKMAEEKDVIGIRLVENLIKVCEKWEILPSVAVNRYLPQIQQYLNAKIDNTYELRRDAVRVESNVNNRNQIKYTIDSQSDWSGARQALKSFVENTLKIFPFFSAAFRNIRQIDGEDKLETGENHHFYPGYLKVGLPFGGDWDSSPANRVLIFLHEACHALHQEDLFALSDEIDIEQLIATQNYQLELAQELLDEWLKGNNSKDILFSSWMFNVNGLDENSFFEMATEFNYSGMKIFSGNIDENVNSFMYWALRRYRAIIHNRDQGMLLNAEEIQFLNSYAKFDIGNLAVTHVCHHLETFFPVLDYYNLNFYTLPEDSFYQKLVKSQLRLFREICRRLLNRDPDLVINDVTRDIMGITGEFGRGYYSSEGNIYRLLYQLTSKNGDSVVRDFRTNNLMIINCRRNKFKDEGSNEKIMTANSQYLEVDQKNVKYGRPIVVDKVRTLSNFDIVNSSIFFNGSIKVLDTIKISVDGENFEFATAGAPVYSASGARLCYSNNEVVGVFLLDGNIEFFYPTLNVFSENGFEINPNADVALYQVDSKFRLDCGIDYEFEIPIDLLAKVTWILNLDPREKTRAYLSINADSRRIEPLLFIEKGDNRVVVPIKRFIKSKG